MITVTLRGLLTRKLRTLLTMIAILLGVAMIAGTYVLTDTINHSFDQIFTQADQHLDAVVTGKQVISSDFRAPPTLPASLLKVVSSTPGVAAADGEIGGEGQLYSLAGKQVGGVGGAPSLLISSPIARFRSSTLVRGHEPHGRQIVVDETTFSRSHLHLGERLRVATVHTTQVVTLVGALRFGSVNSLGGAALVEMDLRDAQIISGKLGQYDQISVAADQGVSQAELVKRIKARIPPALHGRVKVKTAAQDVVDQTSAIGTALNFLTIALLAFGGIAVFVGAFIIFNTFSITVAQRTREFAMLRTVGATRAQVLRSVISEAFIVGLLASVIGLLAGIGLARGLSQLFIAVGVDLPNSGQIVEARTVIVALLVGTVVTLAAGTWPAIRATRVPPIAALREGAELPRSRWSRYLPLAGAVLSALAVLLLIIGIFAPINSAGQRLSIIGLGALLLFLGVAIFSPRIVVPLASGLGWPIERMTNITGRLARENAVRNPTRTAVTAAALMIGLALVGFVTIFAAELRQTANDAIDREVAGTYAVYGQQTIPTGVAPLLRKVKGVQTVAAISRDSVRVAGAGTKSVDGIQTAQFPQVYRFTWKSGQSTNVQTLGTRDALIADSFASDYHFTIGSHLHVTTALGRHDTYRVVGIFKRSQLLSNIVIPYGTLARDAAPHSDYVDVVQAAPGANVTALENKINALLTARFPTAQAHSQQQIKDENNKGVNQLLALIYVLLGLSVLVSLFGIINTLVLSIYERTREIGMLRAIGTTRTQVRWIIRWESVITSVIGAILGLVLGIILAVLITQGLQSQGIEFAFPIGQLLIWVVFAVLFGIVAAAWPARRAARLDVLQAVAYE